MSHDTPSKQVTVAGVLDRFTCRNPETGWAMISTLEDTTGTLITPVWPVIELADGQRLRRIGEHDPHPKFGPQIKVETFEAITPSKAAGTEAHLARPSALRNSGLRQ